MTAPLVSVSWPYDAEEASSSSTSSASSLSVPQVNRRVVSTPTPTMLPTSVITRPSWQPKRPAQRRPLGGMLMRSRSAQQQANCNTDSDSCSYFVSPIHSYLALISTNPSVTSSTYSKLSQETASSLFPAATNYDDDHYFHETIPSCSTFSWSYFSFILCPTKLRIATREVADTSESECSCLLGAGSEPDCSSLAWYYSTKSGHRFNLFQTSTTPTSSFTGFFFIE
ncbi:hypothetical protein DL96DRAFT_344455 [Flagelloscypha sp. PMI_526]|nr:hypothetical protein DL96DRAFT_344455 [Flagelloscypha sp. PMI_526]